MPDVRALLAGAAAGEPAHHLVVVDDEFEHHRQRGAHLGKHAVEDLGLQLVAREAVEQEAVAGVALVEAFLHHRDGDFVGHQVTGVHVALGFVAKRGAMGDVRIRKMSPVEIFGTDRWEAMN